tara:strand:- start:348 stop:767 length:420 start_codon:yes stop_codon:yes gene_type:complete
MSKKSEFIVPRNYFKNFEIEIFEKLKRKKTVFTVPKNYFENIDSEIIIKKEKSRILYKNLFIYSSFTSFLVILLVLSNFNEEEYVDATYLVNDILEENYDYTSQNLLISQYSSDYTYQDYDNQIIMSNLDTDYDYIIID